MLIKINFYIIGGFPIARVIFFRNRDLYKKYWTLVTEIAQQDHNQRVEAAPNAERSKSRY